MAEAPSLSRKPPINAATAFQNPPLQTISIIHFPASHKFRAAIYLVRRNATEHLYYRTQQTLGSCPPPNPYLLSRLVLCLHCPRPPLQRLAREREGQSGDNFLHFTNTVCSECSVCSVINTDTDSKLKNVCLDFDLFKKL